MDAMRINGDTALAWGAIEAGVSCVTGYPGSPGTGTFTALSDTAGEYGHDAEWCLNERIALDVAAGVSQGGRRVLVCMKSVGMNVALDTLMVLNMTGVHAGLVILMGDDPGAWGSQNEQDGRFFAPLAEIPMLEPATPAEGRRMMRWAFEFSESFRTVVILRITRSFSVCEADLPPVRRPASRQALEPDREPMRWISSLSNCIPNHRRLHRNLKDISHSFEDIPFNRIDGAGELGVIASGFVHNKLQDALEGADISGLRFLKLASIYPLPGGLIADFLKRCRKVLVLEEVDPYLEDGVKTIGYDAGVTPPVIGKRSGHVPGEGELFRWQMQQALKACLPDLSPKRVFTEAGWQEEKPYRKSHCAGCPYNEILAALREEAAALGQNPFLTADPGCVVIAARYLDTKLCMGSAVGAALGLQKAGIEERAVAITGDSAFYHSSVNALIHAGSTGANLLLVVLDNAGSLTTGGQPTPDRGVPVNGKTGPVVAINNLAAACGVDQVWTVEEADPEARMRSVFREALQNEGLGLVTIRRRCEPVD
ncbi:MAG: thiamine pyrophosphate-dependent enzyme [Gemmatimonadota bacterium]|nr:thiamine pyrophosphate-dependent enzyme [Gemmatimonadota bacterium]